MIPKRSNRIATLLAALLLAACARTPPATEPAVEWPADLPPLEFYEAAYAEDASNRAVQTRKKYLSWVVRFYKGWDLYQDGWDATMRDILLGIEGRENKDRVEAKLEALGRAISAEWAKDADDRRVHSRELSIWGQALLKALNADREEILIDKVTRDVEALMAGRMERTDVSLKRYQRVIEGRDGAGV